MMLYFQGGPPFWQGREVGEDVSCHHIQTRFCELQMNSLQALVRLRHCIFIGRAQAAGGGGGVHPTPGSRKGYSRGKRTKEGEERATRCILNCTHAHTCTCGCTKTCRITREHPLTSAHVSHCSACYAMSFHAHNPPHTHTHSGWKVVSSQILQWLTHLDIKVDKKELAISVSIT